MANVAGATSAISGAARSLGRLSSAMHAASICPPPALPSTQTLLDEGSVLASEAARLADGPRVSSMERSASHSLRFEDGCTQSGLKQSHAWSLDRTAFESTKAGPSSPVCSSGRVIVASGGIPWQDRPDSSESAVFQFPPVGPQFSCGGSNWEPAERAKHMAAFRRARMPVRKPQRPLRKVQSVGRGTCGDTRPSLPSAVLSQSSEAVAWQLYLDHVDASPGSAAGKRDQRDAEGKGVRERAVFLEELGVDTAAAIVRCPPLMDASLPTMRAAVHFLRVDVGMCRPSDVERAVRRCPQILTADVETRLLPVLDYLRHDLGMSAPLVKKAVVRCPALLVQPLDAVIRRAVHFLRSMGVENMPKVVANNPSLLSVDPNTKLLPKLTFLQQQGLTPDEARKVLARCPAIFNCSIARNLAPKLDFLTGPMRRSVKEIVSFPQFFAFSLDGRIQPRFRVAAERGALSLGLGTLLALPDDLFLECLDMREGSCHAAVR